MPATPSRRLGRGTASEGPRPISAPLLRGCLRDVRRRCSCVVPASGRSGKPSLICVVMGHIFPVLPPVRVFRLRHLCDRVLYVQYCMHICTIVCTCIRWRDPPVSIAAHETKGRVGYSPAINRNASASSSSSNDRPSSSARTAAFFSIAISVCSPSGALRT